MLETYNPFGGGINSKDDARDIAKNELVDCLNIMVDSVGKVRTSGSEANVSSEDFEVDIQTPGDGLFVWNADANWDKDDGVGDLTSPTEFMVIYNSADGEVWISPSQDDTSDKEAYVARGAAVTHSLSSVNMDMGSNTGSITDGKATFYAADNALRVLNANFLKNTTLEGRWFGFISRSYFPYSSGNFMISTAANKWYVDDNKLNYPTKGFWSKHVMGTSDTGSSNTALHIVDDSLETAVATELNTGANYWIVDHGDPDNVEKNTGNSAAATSIITGANDTNWNETVYSIHPPDGKGFCVDIEKTSSTDSMWANGNYHIGQSFVFVGGQESRVATLKGGSLTLAEDEYPTFTVTTTGHGTFANGQGFNPRIIGGRIYTRRADRGAQWRLAVDLSFERGTRMSLNHGFDYWKSISASGNGSASTGTSANFYFINTSSYAIKAPSPETYQTINGYDSQQPGNSFGWSGWGARAAVVANQRAFLGNVKYKDETGSVAVHSDRVLFSPVGKYDTFPTNHFIDIGLGDGDDIVNILETSDRLLVFKSKKLYVVNIGSGSDAGWFIEGEYPYKGIANKSAAFKTDVGCIWANKNGCYMFDGRQVADLTEKLSDELWETFIGTAKNTVVGYIPKKNQVIVVKNAAMTSSGTHNQAYIYDLRTRSWVRNDSLFTAGSDKDITNFQIYDNDLIYARAVSDNDFNFQKINPTSGSQKVQFVTKDEDFGQPGLKKKFYKIYVNYRNNEGSEQHLRCLYSVNGVSKDTTVATARTGYAAFGSTQAIASGTTWKIATFEASSPISGQSISLYFDTDNGSGTLEAQNIEINEVTIEWRPLRQRAST